MKKSSPNLKRIRRKIRIRAKIKGTSLRPRVSIFRSNQHLYLQAIDDQKGATLAACSDLKPTENISHKMAEDLKKLKIKKIIFDRSGYKYHGKVKKIAEELRKAGLEF